MAASADSTESWSDIEEDELRAIVDSADESQDSQDEDVTQDEDNSDEEDDENQAIRDRFTEELRSTLNLLDNENLEFDFQPEPNAMHFAPQFDGSNEGPAHNLPADASPMDYFSLFYTDQFLDEICDLTNKNAAYKIEKGKFPKGYGNWKTLAKDELKAFYAVRTFIKLYCKDRITSIWRKTRAKHYLLHTPGPAIIFSKNRYKQICALLHYCDETQAKARDDPEYDRLFKVRKLTDFLKTKFKQYYNPSQNISVDECMIPVRGDKPVKWGVKVWMLCDSETGYNLNFDVYCGKDPDFEHVNNIGLVSGVVLKLCQIYFGKGHTVYTDRFYTSPTLLHLLHKVDLLGCGTVMTNREHFPKQLIKKESECKIQGESEWLQCSKTGIVATRWTEKRPIYFLSNAHVPSFPDCTVQRTDKKGNKLTVPATPSVVEYNKYMGGVDLNDKMSRLDKSRKTYKWYARIDKKGIMWAMFNAYVLYKHIHKDADYRKFQLDVIHGLIDGNTFIARNEPNERSTSSMARLHGKSHTPVLNASASSNNRCVVCREKWKHARLSQSTVNQVKAAKTKYQCRECDVYICIKRDSTCWADYHSKERYWL